MLSAPVGAQDEGEDTEPKSGDEIAVQLTAAGGVGDIFRPGVPVPVDIVIEADQLITGELRLNSRVGSTAMTHRLDLEIPGGSTKRFVLAAPTPLFDPPEISVDIVADGATLASVAVEIEARNDTELVGVLPLVANPDDVPPSSDLAVATGSARLQPVTAELLGGGLGTLSVFDSLAATAADIEALSTPELDALLAWVDGGGHLLVDERTGPVPRVPSEWQPEAGVTVPAGLGALRLTEGLAKAGSWEEILLPTPTDSAEAAGNLDLRSLQGLHGSLAGELSRDAGFDLPPVSDLLLILLVYALLAGPVAVFVLRRVGRPTLLWVTVPVLALVFTGVIVVAADQLRGNTSAAHATLVVDGPAGGWATTYVLVDDSAGGIELPRGWSPAIRGGRSALETSARGTITIEPVGSGLGTRLGLGTGEFGITAAHGPVAHPGLTVTASSTEDGVVTGEVLNETGRVLSDVVVFSVAGGIEIGRLGDGELREFEIRGLDEFSLPGSVEREFWDDRRFGGRATGGAVNLGLWVETRTDRGGANESALGSVLVVGWSADLPAPVVDRDGTTIPNGRTAVVSQVDVSPAGDAVTNMTMRRQLVRGPADTPIGDNFGQIIGGTYQVIVPATADMDRPLSVHIPRYVSEAEVWDGGRWRSLSFTAGEERDMTIDPADTVVHGTIHLRVGYDQGQIFEFDNGQILTISQGPA